jgi:hypothetical protein
MFRHLLMRLKQFFYPQQHVFLRIAKVKLWESNEAGDPPTAENAVAGLSLRDEEKCLSLYRLGHENEVAQLACIYSLALRDNPDHFQYVLFPESILSGYSVIHSADPDHQCC